MPAGPWRCHIAPTEMTEGYRKVELLVFTWIIRFLTDWTFITNNVSRAASTEAVSQRSPKLSVNNDVRLSAMFCCVCVCVCAGFRSCVLIAVTFVLYLGWDSAAAAVCVCQSIHGNTHMLMHTHACLDTHTHTHTHRHTAHIFCPFSSLSHILPSFI